MCFIYVSYIKIDTQSLYVLYVDNNHLFEAGYADAIPDSNY